MLQRNSQHSVLHGGPADTSSPAIDGLLYADVESRMVMRIKMEMDGLENFPINRATGDLNYDFVEISGVQFVLPLKAEVALSVGRYSTPQRRQSSAVTNASAPMRRSSTTSPTSFPRSNSKNSP